MLVINALDLHNMHSGTRKMFLYHFCFELIAALLPPAPEQPLRTQPINVLHRLVKTEERGGHGDRLRKRCGVCSKKGIRIKVDYVCCACPE